MRSSKLFILFIGSFLLINCLKEENTNVIITLNEVTNNDLGKKGTIIISSTPDSTFNFIDTSKATNFKSKLINNKKEEYQVDCGFFKAEGCQLYTFCNYDENIPVGNYTLDISGVTPITIEEYTITLKAGMTLELIKSDKDIIDIYSDKQTINVEAGKENYELRFKISSYHNEPIMLWTDENRILIDCSEENNKELVCPISKNQLESILITNGEQINVANINYRSIGKIFNFFYLVPPIDVKYNLPKTDVYVRITKLIENVAEHDTFIAYETNVTDITNVYTSLEAFELEFSNSNTGSHFYDCSFRKYSEYPLLIICWINNEGTHWLKEITEEKIFNDINIKYNFRIQSVNNEEKIDFKSVTGTFIFFNYPNILDFTKSDSLSIEYALENPTSLVGLTFNENKEDLSCQTIGKFIKKCTVHKSHFDGKTNGYYFLKHKNHLNGKSTSYEGLPVKVVLNGSKFNKASFTLVYSLLLILIMF